MFECIIDICPAQPLSLAAFIWEHSMPPQVHSPVSWTLLSGSSTALNRGLQEAFPKVKSPARKAQ